MPIRNFDEGMPLFGFFEFADVANRLENRRTPAYNKERYGGTKDENCNIRFGLL